MKLHLKRIIEWEYLPFAIFALLMGFLQFFLFPTGDDLAYGEYFKQYSLISFCQMVVNDWSSRVIIMPIAAFFADGRFNLFLFFNTIGYFLLPLVIGKIFISKGDIKGNWVLVFLLLCVPFVEMMASAGWLVTSIHYFWPLVFGLISLYPIKKILYSEKILWQEYLVYIPAIIFAANMEIMAAVIFAFYFIFGAYFLYSKQKHWLVFLQGLLAFIGLVFVFVCPGNSARAVIEVKQFFPDYLSLDLLDKLVLSGTSVVTSIDPNLILLVISLMLGFYLVYNFKSWWIRIIGTLPFVLCIIVNFLRLFRSGKKFSEIVKGIVGESIYEMLHLGDLINVIPGEESYLIALFIAILYGLILVLTYLIFKDSKWLWIALLVMMAGIMTRAVMGLSPTIFVSGTRTFLFQYVANAIYGLILFLAFPVFWREKGQKFIFVILGMIGSLGYCISLFRVIF